jgi:hypothetical protein
VGLRYVNLSVGLKDSIFGLIQERLLDRLQRMVPWRLLLVVRPVADGGNHGGELVRVLATPHPCEVGIRVVRRSAERGVVASVMADFVEYRARHQITRGDLPVAIPFDANFFIVVLPLSRRPRYPVSALGVADEEQHLARLRQFEGKHQARVVDTSVQREGKLFRRMQPIRVNPAPIRAR